MESINLTNTLAGLAAIQRAMAGEDILFTKLEIGDGVLTNTDVSGMTGLVNKTKDYVLGAVQAEDSEIVRLRSNISNTGVTQDLIIREYGIYAKFGNEQEFLFAYLNVGNLTTPLPNERIGRYELNRDFILYIGNSLHVDFTSNGHLIYVSFGQYKNQIDKMVKDIDLSRTEKIVDQRLNDNSIPAKKLKTSTNADRIKPENLSEEVLAMMRGDTPVSPGIGDKEVVREKVADEAIGYRQLDSNVSNAFSEGIPVDTATVTSTHLNLEINNSTISCNLETLGNFRLIQFDSRVKSFSFTYFGFRAISFSSMNGKFISVTITGSNPTTEAESSIKTGAIYTGIDNGDSTFKGYFFSNSIIPTLIPKEGDLVEIELFDKLAMFKLNSKEWFEIDFSRVQEYENYKGNILGFIFGGSGVDLTQNIVAKNLSFGTYTTSLELIKKQHERLGRLEEVVGSGELIKSDITLYSTLENIILENKEVILSRNPIAYESIISLNTNRLIFDSTRNHYWIVVSKIGDTLILIGAGKGALDKYISKIDISNKTLEIVYTDSYHGNGLIYYKQYEFVPGDTLDIINTDEQIEIYIKKQDSSSFELWKCYIKDELNLINFSNDKKIGFALGFSGSESSTNPKSILKNGFLSMLGMSNQLTLLKNDVELIKTQIGINTKKYAVVVVAGQSNAVGYDESKVNGLFISRQNSRVKQLGFIGNDNLKIIPLTHCAQNYQDMSGLGNSETNIKYPGTKGLHLPLGKLLEKELSEDYEILVLPLAYGGTGFTTGALGTYNSDTMKPSQGALKWSSTSPYFLSMVDRLKYVLDMNDENIFIGTVWIQGENDHSNPATHLNEFDLMTTTFFNYFNNNGYRNRVKKGIFDKDIWFNVETVGYWYSLPGCVTIWDNYRKWNPNTYIEIPRNTDSNEINGTGLTSSNRASHFGNDSFDKVIAPLIYERLKQNL